MSTIMELLLPLELRFEGQSYTIDEWRKKVVKEVEDNQKLIRTSKIGTFNMFVSGLLEGYGTKGENQENQRRELLKNTFLDFSDVTEANANQILEQNHYYRKGKAVDIILGAKNIVERDDFQWEHYFQEAEAHFKDGFKNDKFLKIKGVGSTTKYSKKRDYAISQFSTYYCAIDQNISRLLSRTGLFLHGYGFDDFGTSPAENYNFLKWVMTYLATDTGWTPGSSTGYSPKELDGMLWFFSSENGICRNKPVCVSCPLIPVCLTYHHKRQFQNNPES